MASKKCPKCGEDNPAEAVMCWACYTPLSGAPTMAVPGMTGPGMAGAGVASRGVSSAAGNAAMMPNAGDDDRSKKGVDPRLIGGGAFLVLAGLIGFFVMNSMKTEDPGVAAPITTTGDPLAAPVMPVAPASVAPPTLGAPPAAGAAPQSVPAPFTLVVAPSPNYPTGTAGVVATRPGLQANQAAGLAKYAKDQLSRNGRWTNLQICVFSSQQTADTFVTFQNSRKGRPLSGNDYQQLAQMGVWNGTLAYLDSKGKTEKTFYPSANATNWWGQLR